MFRRFVCVAVVVSAGSVLADVPMLAGQITLPLPDTHAYNISSRYSADGRLYVWDGARVLCETVAGSGSLTVLSTVVGSGSADTAGLNFTSDGSTIVVGNGRGGRAPAGNGGLIFTLPITGGTSTTPVATVDSHFDFIPLPQVSLLPGSGMKMLVDSGSADYQTSSVSIVDLQSNVNTPIIASIPGASTALAMDANHRLYVGNGYAATGSGDIRRFDWSAVESAFLSHTPLNWTDGVPFNPDSSGNNSGAGMFFDSRGYLFAGGYQGVAVFAPDGTGRFYPLGDDYYSLTYNPRLDQFFAMPSMSNVANVYNAAAFVPEPAALALALMGTLGLVRRAQRRAA